jgi:hypothetical protein
MADLTPNQKLILRMIRDGATMERATLFTLGERQVAVRTAQLDELRALGLIGGDPHRPAAETIPFADTVSTTVCDHDVVHLVLNDETGKPFAGLSMAYEAFMRVISSVIDDRDALFPSLGVGDRVRYEDGREGRIVAAHVEPGSILDKTVAVDVKPDDGPEFRVADLDKLSLVAPVAIAAPAIEPASKTKH